MCNTLFAVLLVLIVLYPLIYILSSSVSDPVRVASGEVVLFPKGFTLLGYRRVFEDSSILTGYANTIFYTVVGTLINMVVTVPAAYALTRPGLPGNRIITMIFMITMYFSGGMIPTFLLVRSLKLYDTRAVLLILGAFNTYNCIICRSFFASMPKELEDAALIDGCSPIKTFLKIVLPLSKALLGVMVLYFAVAHWNSYFNSMIYQVDPGKQPLQLVLRKILILERTSADMLGGSEDYSAERYQVAQLIKYAVIVVSSAPLLVVYPFLQKYFEKGVMIGSVKG